MYNVELIEKFTKIGACVLIAAIEMKHKTLKTISIHISFLESVDDMVGVGFIGKFPIYDFSGK